MPSETWIRHLEKLVARSLDLSMWGSIPSFPWEKFSQQLSSSLSVTGLSLTAGVAEWREGDLVLAGLGDNPLHLSVECSPLQGSFSVIFPLEDFVKLSSWVIHPEAGNEGFVDSHLQRGFFRYLCLEAMSTLSSMQIYAGLIPKVIEVPLVREEAYCVDVAIGQDAKTIYGRLLFPPLFQESVKKHFSREWNFSIPSHLYRELFVTLSLTVGGTRLSQESWKGLSRGDFVLLEHCSYYPNLKKGTFQLQLDHTPLFHVKLKEENIKLLDYAQYFEEHKMNDVNLGKPVPENGKDIPAEKGDAGGVYQGHMLSPQQVPISLTVEVAKIRINLDKLIQLKPGNVLELGVQPERGVNLVANGAHVGTGELVQVGDVIGVKIIALGE